MVYDFVEKLTILNGEMINPTDNDESDDNNRSDEAIRQSVQIAMLNASDKKC